MLSMLLAPFTWRHTGLRFEGARERGFAAITDFQRNHFKLATLLQSLLRQTHAPALQISPGRTTHGTSKAAHKHTARHASHARSFISGKGRTQSAIALIHPNAAQHGFDHQRPATLCQETVFSSDKNCRPNAFHQYSERNNLLSLLK